MRSLANRPAVKAWGGPGSVFSGPARPAERRAYNPKAARLSLDVCVRTATQGEAAARLAKGDVDASPGSALAWQAAGGPMA